MTKQTRDRDGKGSRGRGRGVVWVLWTVYLIVVGWLWWRMLEEAALILYMVGRG